VTHDGIHIASAASVPADAVRDCLNEAFSDYLIRLPHFEPDSWSSFLHRQGVDTALSRVALVGDRVISFALVTPRSSERWRVTVMGARPETRGSGIAPRLLDETIADAKSRRLRSVELEVFAQNTRALRLYESRGMTPVSVLRGFDATASSRRAMQSVRSVTQDAAARRANEIEAGSGVYLPWQVCGDAIRRLPGVPQCWQSGSAQLVFIEMTGRVLIQSLLDSDPDYARAVGLLATLRDTYPDAALIAPQLQAERGAAVVFRTAGWLQSELYQNLMVRSL